jgi:AGZA family xanthine/uracil permease-like MFS transporter
MLGEFFKLRENGTTVRAELLAGLTTFLTMAYIIFVNPEILAQAGMDRGAVFVATCLAAAAGSVLMGLWANYPIALAPGMGLNVYFTFGVVQAMHVPWQTALGAVFAAGVLFFLVSAFRLRAIIIDAIPASLKSGTAAGIGFLLGIIGLENAGIVAADPATLVRLGDLHSPRPILAGLGFVLILGLAHRRVAGAMVIAILLVAVLGIPFGLTHFAGVAAPPPSLAPTFLKMDLAGVFDVRLAGIVFALLFMELFDNTGTLIGVAGRAGFLDAEGRMPRLGRALMADSAAAMVGAALGTSTTTSYIESIAGVEAGGRTGLTAVAVAILFVAAVFVSPLAASIPAYATAPALLFVACLMARALRELEWDDMTEFGPGVVAAIVTPLTFSIADGIGCGFVAYAGGKLLAGRGRETGIVVWAIAAAYVVKVAVT